jgi:DNA modification methylase
VSVVAQSLRRSPRQGDLFDHVVQAYLDADGTLPNQQLYETVQRSAGLRADALTTSVPVGESGRRHNIVKRTIRWHTQTLKHMGLVERDGSQRGAWRLAVRNRKGLHEAAPRTRLVAFSTKLGIAIWGRCETALAGLDQPITCIVTSPPYPLRKQRAYGGPTDEAEYVDFLTRALEPVIAHLAPGGSLCLNLTNDVFMPGSPARSLYRERLLIALSDRCGLKRMDTIIWFNRSKPPSPVQWASKKRVQLNAGYETIDWLCNDPSRITADNRRVLEAHTRRHLALMARGGEQREACYADGAYRLHPGSFGRPTEGRIPRNVLVRGHRCADTLQYRRDAQALGLPVHGAMQPLAIADFLIRYLSREGDLILDPFGGTVKTGMAAERNGRRWIVIEALLDFLRGAAERFRGMEGFRCAIDDLPRGAVARVRA